MNESASFAADLAPLFDLQVSKIRIDFMANKNWRMGAEPVFRSRMGASLKRKCCPFPGTVQKSCEECVLAATCLYIALFSPISKSARIGSDGRKIPVPTPVRPFVFGFDPPDHAVLEKGETGTLGLTLFGPAIRYCSLFLESVVHALHTFPLSVSDVAILRPARAVDEDTGADTREISWLLADWIGFSDQDTCGTNHDQVGVRFLTPTQMTVNGNTFQSFERLTFILIVKAILRRLRDLKRVYENDKNMGKTGKSFFSAGDLCAVRERQLSWVRRGRYSVSQQQSVFLNGFSGMIRFSGPVQSFLPLLKAAEVVHIGKGTSCGNGRIRIENGVGIPS